MKKHTVNMLPFGARCLRSSLRFSTKLVRRSFITRKQGKLARIVCNTDVADGQWMNRNIQEESRTFISAASQYSLTDACSSILILDSSDIATVTEVNGDDDEVPTSAGKKRKHWYKSR